MTDEAPKEIYAVKFGDEWYICTKAKAKEYGLLKGTSAWSEVRSTAFRGFIGEEDDCVLLPVTTDATLRKINHYLTALENELNTGPVPGGFSGDAAKSAMADLMLIARGKDPAHHEDRLSTFDSEKGQDQ